MIEKKFIDIFGNKWYAAILGNSPVRIESGDYVLFNEEKGFIFCVGDAFDEMYKVSYDENIEKETLFNIDLIKVQTENSKNLKNE